MSDKLNRRAILASAASASVLALPAATKAAAPEPVAAAIPTGPDPILTAIEQHRHAYETVKNALTDEGEAETHWRGEGNTLTPSLLVCTRAQWESHARNPLPWPFEGHEIRLYSSRDIERLFETADPETRKAFRAKLAAIKRKHHVTFGPINTRLDAADQAEADARWELATTAPTTPTGIVAVLRYAREAGFDEEEQHEFYASLERAVSQRVTAA